MVLPNLEMGLEIFHVNPNFSGSLVHREDIQMTPTMFLHFCDYLPFDKDLAL
jgi:hypothetical protein